MNPGFIRHIVAVCGDAGGAGAVLPIIRALRSSEKYSVQSFAYNEAVLLWRNEGLPCEPTAERLSVGEALDILAANRCDLLLTGTSINGVDLEKTFILAARRLGIPSLSVLDFWWNIVERFSDGTGNLAYLPDRIAVMDEPTREEMLSLGFPGSVIVVTGRPGFQELDAVKARATADRLEAVRRELGVATGELMVLFASQPLAEMFGSSDENPRFPGYTEREVTALLAEALGRMAEKRGKPITLAVRPHPREATAVLPASNSALLRIFVQDGRDGLEAALSADLVAGMTSMFLVEACLLGCIVASIQPGLRLPDPLPSNRMGWSRAIYDATEIEPVMERLLFDEEARAAALIAAAGARVPPHAVERVVEVIDSLLQDERT